MDLVIRPYGILLEDLQSGSLFVSLKKKQIMTTAWHHTKKKKINSRCVVDLRTKGKTVKSVEDNRRISSEPGAWERFLLCLLGGCLTPPFANNGVGRGFPCTPLLSCCYAEEWKCCLSLSPSSVSTQSLLLEEMFFLFQGTPVKMYQMPGQQLVILWVSSFNLLSNEFCGKISWCWITSVFL